MKMITSNTDKHYLAVSLSGSDDKEVLGKMAEAMFQEGYVTEGFHDAIIQREENFPTGLPTGEINVAIPHTDPEYVKKPAICLGVLDQPVEFCVMGMEGEKTRVSLLFMLAIKKKEDQLGLLQKLIEAWMSTDFRGNTKLNSARFPKSLRNPEMLTSVFLLL